MYHNLILTLTTFIFSYVYRVSDLSLLIEYRLLISLCISASACNSTTIFDCLAALYI